MPTLRITAASAGDAVISMTLSLRDDDSLIVAEAAFSRQLSIAQPTLDDIRWYLEDFLEEGSGAAQIRANGVRSAIRASGIDLFRAVFSASRETEGVWETTVPNLRNTCIT
jgi:hypothetical protein